MKFSHFTLGLLSLSGLLSVSAPATLAQCVQADASIQYNISGSRQPTPRTNDVVFETNPNCRGNASVTTGVQGNIGGNGRVEQHRQVRHRQDGSDRQFRGISSNTVQIRPHVEADIYNPAANFNYQNR